MAASASPVCVLKKDKDFVFPGRARALEKVREELKKGTAAIQLILRKVRRVIPWQLSRTHLAPEASKRLSWGLRIILYSRVIEIGLHLALYGFKECLILFNST